MKKALVGFFLILLMSVVGVFVWQQSLKAPKNIQQFRIALFARKGLSYERVILGFMQKLQQDKGVSYLVDTYYADGGDKIASTAVIEEALSRNSDLLVTIGALYSQIAKTVTEKRKLKTPIVFSGAADPVGLGLVETEGASGNNVTGVNNLPDDILQPARVLLMLYPRVKRLLIPHELNATDSGNLEKTAHEIAKFLKKKGVSVRLLPVVNAAEILPKTKGLIAEIDVVMTLEGGIAFSVTDGLIKLCRQHGVAFFGNELDAVRHGAPFGFAADFSVAGARTFDYVRKILIDGMYPSQLPVKYITEGRRVAVNMQALAELNISLPGEIELCLRCGTVFDEIIPNEEWGSACR